MSKPPEICSLSLGLLLSEKSGELDHIVLPRDGFQRPSTATVSDLDMTPHAQTWESCSIALQSLDETAVCSRLDTNKSISCRTSNDATRRMYFLKQHDARKLHSQHRSDYSVLQ